MIRTPPSLKWLVRRRARVKGLIESSERELPRLLKVQGRLSGLKADLEALDRILLTHEIPIVGSTIPAIWPKWDLKIRMRQWFAHGELTRSLLKLLADCESGRMTTEQLAQGLLLKVCLEHPDQALDGNMVRRFRDLVHRRLMGMRRAGSVASLWSAQEIASTKGEQEWVLPARNSAHHSEDAVDL